MEYRQGEESSAHFRAERFFCISGDWYFSSREHLQIGPFQNKEDAEMELMLYLRHINEGGIYLEHYKEGASLR